MKSLESMITYVNDDPTYNIITKQKVILQKCEFSAVATSKQCKQLFYDILCKQNETATSLKENYATLKKAEHEYSNQVFELNLFIFVKLLDFQN